MSWCSQALLHRSLLHRSLSLLFIHQSRSKHSTWLVPPSPCGARRYDFSEDCPRPVQPRSLSSGYCGSHLPPTVASTGHVKKGRTLPSLVGVRQNTADWSTATPSTLRGFSLGWTAACCDRRDGRGSGGSPRCGLYVSWHTGGTERVGVSQSYRLPEHVTKHVGLVWLTLHFGGAPGRG